jgi:hypothetical protein
MGGALGGGRAIEGATFLAGTVLDIGTGVGPPSDDWVATLWPPSSPGGMGRNGVLFPSLEEDTRITEEEAFGKPSPRHISTSLRPSTRGAISKEPTCSRTRLEATIGSSWETRNVRALSSSNWDSARKRLTTLLRIPHLYEGVPI